MDSIFADRGIIFSSEDLTALVIADIHLGYEATILEKKGVDFPSQRQSMLSRIGKLVEKYKVSEIYLIGDIKHSIPVDRMVNWREIPEFMETLSKLAKVTVIPGNHDGEIEALFPRIIEIADVRGRVLTIGTQRIGLLHGHAWPSAEVLDCQILVIGHNHPTVRRLKDVSSPEIGRPDRIRSSIVVPVALTTELDKNCVRRTLGQLELDDDKCSLVILPSFNELLTGVYINRPKAKLQGPLFDNGCAMLADSEVYSAEGIFLGSVESLQSRYNSVTATK
ncbi:MAG: metallophosphoesterase [Candidatus Thorarchaeota archaeon]|jgi:putative SbcD/Mre11-related phosphoesterase